MDDLMYKLEPVQVQPQPESHTSTESNFEEELRRQNIKTIKEIYGEDFWEKLCRNPPKSFSIH